MRGIVLRKQAYGETDLILDFLMEHGQVQKAFARGARRSKKRFPHQFNQSAVYELHFFKRVSRSQLSALETCELLEYHSHLDSDLENLSRWACVLEWVRMNEDDSHDFEELLAILKSLANRETSLALFFRYFSREIVRHGFYPQLEDCVTCGERMKAPFYFSLAQGGVTHLACSPSSIEISEEALSLWRRWLSEEEVSSLNLPQKLFQDLDQVLLSFLQYQSGRSLKAHQFFVKTQSPAPLLS